MSSEIAVLERKYANMLKEVNKTTKNEKNTDRGVKSSVNNVIDLSKDNELSKRIGNLTGAPKYKIIQEYILEVLGGQPIVMSDGKKVFVDKSDALHVANKAANKKISEISQIKKLVKYAQLYSEDIDAKHPKFNQFYYYKANVKLSGKIFPVFLNVGKTINDRTYHLYDVTEKIRDTAHRVNDVGRPKPNEGYALKNGISNKRVPQSNSSVNSNYMQNGKKNSITAEKDVKQKQLEIIQETNPMWDEYHTGIRAVDDILTWEEVLKLDDEREGQFVWGDFSRAEAEQALKDGAITVYSSYPIKNGVFVSTSQIQAQEYAGGKNGKVYSKTIPLTDVAWINGDEGQYAKTNITANTDVRYSVDNNKTAKNVYKYTEEQYNAFGWTRYDNILTNAMIERLTSKLYEMSEQNAYFHQTKNGEYIIPIGEDYGEYDVLVYTNGNYENPSITKVIKLQSEDEYLKEEIWRNLLNGKELTESIVTTTLEDVEAVYGTESIERFISRDSTSFQEYERGIERQISREIGNRVGKRNSVDRVGSESQADTKGNIRRNSITPETDAEYMSEVEKGDT